MFALPAPLQTIQAAFWAWRRLGFLLVLMIALPACAADSVVPSSGLPWWFWPLALFVTCFLIGIVAVPAGIGGGTLFVPIIGGFFPFHLDFVRGAGLLVALASALAAGRIDSRLPRPFTTAASIIISFLRCCVMSSGNIAFTDGATSNRRP